MKAGDERRASFSKEQKDRNANRRASMMTMMDTKKMNLTDHRGSSAGSVLICQFFIFMNGIIIDILLCLEQLEEKDQNLPRWQIQ